MTSQQPIGQQQKVGGQGSLGSTWSDPSVNISLDFLSAGLNPTKSPPTLNNIIQQQGKVPYYNSFSVLILLLLQREHINYYGYVVCLNILKRG